VPWPVRSRPGVVETDVYLVRACRPVSAQHGHDADIWLQR